MSRSVVVTCVIALGLAGAAVAQDDSADLAKKLSIRWRT